MCDAWLPRIPTRKGLREVNDSLLSRWRFAVDDRLSKRISAVPGPQSARPSCLAARTRIERFRLGEWKDPNPAPFRNE